jgi:hypothetical protein
MTPNQATDRSRVPRVGDLFISRVTKRDENDRRNIITGISAI